MPRYLYGWLCWFEALRKARAKRHGAGKQRWSHALKTAACYRYLVDGQHCRPRRVPRWARRVARKVG